MNTIVKRTVLFYKDDFVTVSYDNRHGWIHIEWHGYQIENSIRKGYEKAVEAVQQHPCKKLLNNLSGLTGIWTPAVDWVSSEWFPAIREAGIQHIAWVFSNSRLSQFSSGEVLQQAQIAGIKTFADVQEAEEWLEGQ